MWLDQKNKPAVIWAFRNATIAHTGPVVDVATGQRLHAGGRLEVTEGHVYQLGVLVDGALLDRTGKPTKRTRRNA